MGVSNLNAEMLLANYFSAGMLAKYAKALGKSDKGSAATLAERAEHGCREHARTTGASIFSGRRAHPRFTRHAPPKNAGGIGSIIIGGIEWKPGAETRD